MRRALIWLFALVAIAALVAFVGVRGRGISARRDPWPGEAQITRAAWRFMIPRESRDAANPVADSPAVITEGLRHFADHCASCHANDGSGDTPLGRRTFPPAPDLRATRTQSLTDGELFYAIEQGIPWTAMAAWGNGTPDGERDSWALVRFIRHLPKISPAELAEMARYNPKSPAQADRDKDIDAFLKGGK
jgi:mono/diheme cytochrome c family protein